MIHCIKSKRVKVKEQYHYPDSLALFFTEDKLQIHMYMPASFKGKYVIPNTFLNHQSGLNSCPIIISISLTTKMKSNTPMHVKTNRDKPVREISFPSASWSVIIKLSQRVVKGLCHSKHVGIQKQKSEVEKKKKKAKSKSKAKAKAKIQKSKQCSESLQWEFPLVPSLVLSFSHGNCIMKDELG